MRICYVVQRYGPMIAGGAEQHCREMAERMAARGHHVEVITTCAQSYIEWKNVFEPGTSTENGVIVTRVPVARPREEWVFNDFNRRVTTSRGARPRFVQEEWMRLQGPFVPALGDWLETNAHRFDCVVAFTYLYWTTWITMRDVTGTVPVVLHPTVHDEPPLRLSLFDRVFRSPDAFALSTPEEIDLIRRRFHVDPAGAVVGIGVEMPGAPDRGAIAAMRDELGIGDVPYLLYLGRIDHGKGVGELLDWFVHFRDRHPNEALKLVMLGQSLLDIPQRDDIVAPGFVDYATRDAALADAFALSMPSYFESFSMVLTEAFAHRRPALVQGRCDVLRGHARRSGAAFAYEGYAEFECALELLLEDDNRRTEMGDAGRAYVEREYHWDVVLDRYETLLERTAGLH